MKPLMLSMQAFGPFKNKVNIDFSYFGQSGIYLVAGDTGAGKTTIFDAICFALYGEASGTAREVKMLRNNDVENTLRTEVVFEFEHQNQRYLLRRTSKNSKNDDYDVEFHLPSGSLLTRKTDVKDAVERIIGLTKGQFMQVIMIAQGDFTKLLETETKNRSEIFRHLFGTGKFLELQEMLKLKSSEKEKQAKKAKEQCEELLSQFNIDEDLHNYILAHVGIENNEHQLQTALEEHIQHHNQQLSQLENHRQAMQKNLLAIENTLVQAHALNQAFEKFEKEQNYLNTLQSNLPNLKAELAKCEESIQSFNFATKKIQLENEIQKFKDIEPLHNKLLSLEHNKSLEENKIHHLTQQINDLKQHIEQNETIAFNFKHSAVKQSQLEHDILSLRQQYTTLQNVLKVIEEHNLHVEKLSHLKTEQGKLLQAYTHLSRTKATLLENYIKQTAGRLANDLQANTPCPVCGSLTHPKKAVLISGEVTQANINQAEEEETQAKDAYEKANSECHKLETLVSEKAQAIHNLSQEVLEHTNLSILEIQHHLTQKQKQLEIKGQEMRKQIEQLKHQAEEKEKADTALPKLRQQKEQLTLSMQSALLALEKIKTEILETQKQCQNLQSQLSFNTLDEVHQALTGLNIQKSQLETQQAQAKASVDQATQGMFTTQGVLMELSKQIEGKSPQNTQALEEQKQGILDELQQLNENFTQLQIIINTNKNTLPKFIHHYIAWHSLEKQWQDLLKLSKTANGDLPSKQKITLETFAQQSYFDLVLSRANHHFIKMTKEQYRLLRKKESTNNQSKVGLDLDVKDNYTGKIRDAKSLSGGEKFKAALSLAFGLSEVIQHDAGGIRMDSIFIDEGFGTLSEEDLKDAMQAILDISTNNRLVGIISHVPQLKEKIENQIIITKSPNGQRTISMKY